MTDLELAGVTPEEVLGVAAETFGVGVEDLTSSNRARPVILYRTAAIAACRLATMYSLADIGRVFCRHHTSASDAVRRAKENDILWQAATTVAVRAIDRHTRRLHGRPTAAEASWSA